MSHHEHDPGLPRPSPVPGRGAAVPALAGMSLTYVSAQEPKAAAGKAEPNEKWGIPGPYPGRVIEVRNPRMIKNDVKDRGAIHAAVDRGMKELTGATDDVEAWRSFFEPGDVVGVKMNPVGNPLANSLERADARGHRRAQGGRGQDEGHHRLRALSRRVHRGQDARGRARRHRLDRAGDRATTASRSTSRGTTRRPATSTGSPATTPTSSW